MIATTRTASPLPGIGNRWSSLNRLGTSKVIRSSYLWLLAVPVAAKSLARLPGEVEVPLWEQVFVLDVGLPFSWTIFYLAAVFFALASAVYSTTCPAIVGHYRDATDYQEQGRGGRELAQWISTLLRRGMAGSTIEDRTAIARYFVGSYCHKNMGSAENILNKGPGDYIRSTYYFDDLTDVKVDANMLRSAFWYVYDQADSAFPIQRILCASLYGCGIATISALLVQNFIYVARVAIS